MPDWTEETKRKIEKELEEMSKESEEDKARRLEELGRITEALKQPNPNVSAIRPNISGFTKELASLLNKYSMESPSNTPDFVLADYLMNCWQCFNVAIKRREKYTVGDKGNIT